LTPDNVESAQVAGVQFARALGGAPRVAFMPAFGEQQRIVRCVIMEAGFGGDVACRVAESFEAGAKVEWQRLSSSLQAGTHGHA